jgi:signal transduction histidine kinase
MNSSPPPVIIEGVLLDNQPAPLASKINVPAGTASIQFQFTAPSLTSPGKVAFRYLMEGLDSDWSDVAFTRSARYPKVSPGKYNFRVVARNNDGFWNETGATATLIIAPFWWQTHWFRFGMVLLMGSIAAALYRLRKEREREIERLRVKIANDLHDDVGSSLWSITMLSRMLAQQGTLATEAQHDVSEINRIAVQTSNSIRDIIWLINPSFDSMQELVLRVKDSAAVNLRGIVFRLNTEGMDLTARIPPQVRQNLLFLIKEALTNIAKHARAKEVDLKARDLPEHWQFTIADDGIGFDPSRKTSGNGLRSMQVRAGSMGGSVTVCSSPGNGTKLVIMVPKQRTAPFFSIRGFQKNPGARKT